MKAADKIGTKVKHARKFAEFIDTLLASQDELIDVVGDFTILRFTHINEVQEQRAMLTPPNRGNIDKSKNSEAYEKSKERRNFLFNLSLEERVRFLQKEK